MIGKKLAHYEITALLGKGGMGEVYRARDTKLNRDVAIKVLSPDMSDDSERIARFRREALTLATLQHAHIASVYGFEDSEDARFLVMEAVEGEDLSERLQRGALELDDALEFARQIAVGLEAAHEKGIVHRDLKPANVMVTAEGQVKILDFGLASAYQGDEGVDSDPATSPTIAAAVTGVDTLLGTAAYMSPEQTRGHAVDQRSDIWAFGVILFEMLSGRVLFEGDTVSDKLASILKSEPQWDALPASTPPRVREILERCLAKRRRDRMKDIGDVRLEIEWIQQGKTTEPVATPAEDRGIRLAPALIGAVALAALVGLGVWTLRPDGAASENTSLMSAPHRLSLEFPRDLTVEDWLVASDGTLAISARPQTASSSEDDGLQLYVREADRYQFQLMEGSTGLQTLCFSHDSKWIAWLAPDQASATGLYLWKAPVDRSSPALRVRSWRDEWRPAIHWLRDGDMVTATFRNELLRIPADGSDPGDPVLVHGGAFDDEFVPNASSGTELPDGVHVFDTVEVWTEDGYSRQIAVANVNTGEAHVVMTNAYFPNWVDSGHLLFSRGPTILAVRFDPSSLTVEGQPVAVADGLRTPAAWDHGEFGLSADGDLFHRPGGIVGQRRQLQWSDRSLEGSEAWSQERRAFELPLRMDPDGRQLAIVIAASNGVYETWVSEVGRPALRRFAFEQGRDCVPVLWSPDGSRLIYASTVSGGFRLMSAALDGRSTPELFFESSDPTGGYSAYNAASFADGGELLLIGRRSQGRFEVMLLQMGEGQDAAPKVLLTGAAEPQISPDGQWLAYESDASGRVQIYIRRWLGRGELGPEIPVSLAGGTKPFWYRENENAPLEIWYTEGTQIFSVVLESASKSTLSRPRLVADRDPLLEELLAAPDGRLLTLRRGEDETDPGRLNVILNWRTELQERLQGDS